jgi:uncharacterized protein
MITEPLQWIFAVLGAFMVGVAKTGIAGLSFLSIALFTHVFASSKQATGLVLPLLIFGDIIAVLSYRRHTQWRFLIRLFPWTALGVVLGYLTLGRISDQTAKMMVGAIIVALVTLSYWRRSTAASRAIDSAPLHWSLGALVGVTAGFITLVANAAGPLMAIYLIAMRLPKLQYAGTAAVFFLLLNLFKVPFMIDLGLVTRQSFTLNLLLAPAVLVGALGGRWLLAKVNQKLFEQLVLALSAIGGILLFL